VELLHRDNIHETAKTKASRRDARGICGNINLRPVPEAALVLAPWARRRRQDLLDLPDRLTSKIQELTLLEMAIFHQLSHDCA
jgi:hypothetical protein